MNGTKRMFIVTIIIAIMISVSGCGKSTDYSFWEGENQVRIVLQFDDEKAIELEDDTFTEVGDLDMPSIYDERIETLQSAIITYFNDTYAIDISSQIARQELKLFTSDASNGSMTMGYVATDDPDILNLNVVLLGDYSDYFDNTYVHETLHQIGFQDTTATMITEGIVDALTDLILQEAGIESYPTDDYYYIRQLGYQILAVDKELSAIYLENENPKVGERITMALKSATYPFESVDAGKRLEDVSSALVYGIGGTADMYYVAFEAQEIVQAYCQTFSPSTEVIDYIRALYIVEDYESVTIETDEGNYIFTF